MRVVELGDDVAIGVVVLVQTPPDLIVLRPHLLLRGGVVATVILAVFLPSAGGARRPEHAVPDFLAFLKVLGVCFRKSLL